MNGLCKEEFWRQGAFLNLLKPCGMTSHDVVDVVRRAWRRQAPFELEGGAREPKVGHLGTLDPDASGVLPLALGRATKLIPSLPPADKCYVAEVTLGLTSHSCDVAGQLAPGESFDGGVSELDAALAKYTGTILQRPPQVSALKQGGKKGYERARQGEVFELEPRPTVYYEVVRLGQPFCWFFGDRFPALQSPVPSNWRCFSFRLRVHCGSGTYVRALARDIGQDLGCGALLSGLVRTQSGPFQLDRSVELERLSDWPFTSVSEVRLDQPGKNLPSREVPR